MEAAGRAGLDFVALTDHNTLAARSQEGWWGRTLLIVGQEVSPEKEHYLAFGLDHVVRPVLGEADRYMAEVAAGGGFGFVAHPFDRGNPRVGVPGYEWRPLLSWAEGPENAPPDGPFAGLEVWNYYSEWLGSERTVPQAVRALVMPRVFGPGPPALGLALWDALGRQRRVAGIGGLDAHGTDEGFPWGRLRVMGYDFAFATLRTNVLLERPLSTPAGEGGREGGNGPAGDGPRHDRIAAQADDIQAILEALRGGRALLVDASQGPAKGARFRAVPADVGGSTRSALPGDEILPGGEVLPGSPLLARGSVVEFQFAVPAPARLVILRDGKPLARGYGRFLTVVARGPGVYRAEAHRWRGRWRPWILANPIYVRGGDSR